ncbi:chemotaxis protein CheA [Halomonas urumqiensis]|uniref:Chemotaxis protein CheA n=1 Tax=Halomonas urumqiensis TaxID=1684789 RepID=A0A2N7UK85_9GAMM|nr:chemotaxis protein CheA [Halomonas urumqiensis]PMR80853.1 chemotaxis protein CheA [Halomonas urumqiensis]PTB02810.1 chemotaxis protein CheA [Halomonas urumqiensis]GHE21318.1 chemotaxis protein CheA [Halomonas urumqiensis]
MDITDFYDTFFEEAEELLADMERHLLELDVEAPDTEQLNAIFRAAHSIKGGAGTFGFDVLQKTTHIFENLLDHTRRGELRLRRDIVDLFLETKDMLHDQLNAYRNDEAPDREAFERICKTLQQLALEELGESGTDPDSAQDAGSPVEELEESGSVPDSGLLLVALLGVDKENRTLLVEELAQLGEVRGESGDDTRFEVTLETTASADDIEAVMCFIIEPGQIEVTQVAVELGTDPNSDPNSPPTNSANSSQAELGSVPNSPRQKSKPAGESTSIRVSVDKVDQIINLVGELIITQSMLDQTASELEGVTNGSLLNGMSLLQRNARDLQEAVMSIRMVPMDYVFSRYPRLVRDLASKLGKDVELVTEGESTELDKSLTERIIDPLTHLVRNSLDHGIETPEARAAAGKPGTGRLTLSAQHQGGSILIEVIDDGAGLDRERLLAKARESGLAVSDTMSDDEVWQLIFAPGFSTAKEVSDVSGRGVGMDVVKRNIQGMGGHVEILSRPGQGTTTRIVLPLTLAILDGMSIKVGREMFILPLSTVLESLQPRREDLYAMAGDDVVLKVRDEYLPVVAVHEALDVADARTEPTESIAVIVQGEGRRYALLVDDLIGQQQVVVKNLETNYRKVPGVSAATILGDGSVALILDIAGLHRLVRTKKEARGGKRAEPKPISDVPHDRKEIETP